MTTWSRRAGGALWLLLWLVVLHVFTDPWRHLGGLVDERLRWLEGFVLGCGASLGFTAGRFRREAIERGDPRSRAAAMRVLLYPPAIVVAASVAALAALEEQDSIGVVVTAFLAYWCGLDLAMGALPLLEGKPRSFRSPSGRGPPVRTSDPNLPRPAYFFPRSKTSSQRPPPQACGAAVYRGVTLFQLLGRGEWDHVFVVERGF
jgi:hypothetical protein